MNSLSDERIYSVKMRVINSTISFVLSYSISHKDILYLTQYSLQNYGIVVKLLTLML